MSELKKMFRTYNGTKEAFINAGLESTYSNNFVWIAGDAQGNGKCLYIHGLYFADFAELIAALAFVKGVSDGTENGTYNAANGGGYIKFASAEATEVDVTVDVNGVTIGLNDAFVKKVDDVIALVDTINGDYLKAADRTALEGLISDAQSKADEVAADMGNVENLSTTNKTVVAAINEVLAAVGTGGTAAVVTLEKSADGLTYTIKQGTATVGTIDIPKDMVVSSGEVVTNPEGQEAGTYIKLALANVAEPLYINVGTLVDVYKAEQSATQVQLTIANNTISAAIVAGSISTTELAGNAVTTAKIADANVTKAKLSSTVQASLDKADAAAGELADAIASEVERANGAYDSKGAAETAEGNAKEYADDTFVKSADYATDKAKLDGIAEGAQVNVIESVEVNGVAATISGKKASVTVDAYTKAETDNLLGAKANAADVYTQAEVDAMFEWEVIE